MSLRRMRRAALAAALAIAAGCGGALLSGTAASATVASADPTAASATPKAGPGGGKYVALGDSFAAGLGLAPYSASPSPGCFRSTGGIAAQVAAALELDLTDVSCSGATIANVLSTPQAVPGGTVPAQLDALTADTAFVSLMIGGNDAGFSTVLPGCAAASADGPLLFEPASASCAAKYGDQLAANLQGVVGPSLDAALAAIHRKAPNAAIVLLGYPALSPTDAATPAEGCFTLGEQPAPQNTFPFTTADRAYFAELSAQLDSVQEAAAARNGAIFVSNLAGTDTHTACAGTPEPWLNGISVALPPAPDGFDVASLHPNSAGAAYLAGRLAAVFAEATPGLPGEGERPGTSGGGPSAPATTAPAATGPTAELANTGSDSGVLASAVVTLALAALGGGTVLALRGRRARPN